MNTQQLDKKTEAELKQEIELKREWEKVNDFSGLDALWLIFQLVYWGSVFMSPILCVILSFIAPELIKELIHRHILHIQLWVWWYILFGIGLLWVEISEGKGRAKINREYQQIMGKHK